VLSPSPAPATSAITLRGRQLRWNVDVPAEKAPNAAEAA
jgi:hypothetical protein